MKKIIYLLLSLVVLSSCSKFNDKNIENPDKRLINLEIPDGFTFETSTNIDIKLMAVDQDNKKFTGLVFEIYNSHPDFGGDKIAAGSTNENGIFEIRVNIPVIYDSLYISSNYIGISGNMFPIIGNRLDYIFQQNQPVLYKDALNLSSFDNIVTDFADGLGGWKAYRDNGTYAIMLSDAPNTPLNEGPGGPDDLFMWGFDTQGGARSYEAPSEFHGNIYGNYISYDYYLGNTGNATSIQSGMADIRITDGNKVLCVNLDQAFPHQVNGGWQTFYIKLDETATAGSGWRIGNYNRWTTGNGPSTMSNTVATPQQIQDILTNVTGILIAPEGQVGYYSQNGPEFICVDNVSVVESLDDITIYTQGGNQNDADEDGIPDDEDDYPDDASKAFNNYSPSENTYGTLAFEDLWPERGDYDFNDLVIDYRYNVITNADNKAVQMETEFVIQAIGAGFTNGFGFELPVDPSLVESITGLNHSENYLSIATNGTESDQQTTVIIPFDNAKNAMGVTETFVNTQAGETYYEAVTITNTIIFTAPVNTADMGTAPYNPFIIANNSRGYEIHLPGQAPTVLINESLYGNAFDDTNPSQDKYFQSTNNLPWAINIPVSFDYPKEKASIESAHLKFAAWAESGGTVFQDWYIDNSGYRNSNNIYTN